MKDRKKCFLKDAVVLLIAVFMVTSLLPTVLADTSDKSPVVDNLIASVHNPNTLPTFWPVGINSLSGSSALAPGDIIFDQPLDGSNANTLGFGYAVFDNFQLSADVPIGTIIFVVVPLYYSGGWTAGDIDEAIFDVTFFDDAYASHTMTTQIIKFTDCAYTYVPGPGFGTYNDYVVTIELPSSVTVTGQEGGVLLEDTAYSTTPGYAALWEQGSGGDNWAYQVGSTTPDLAYDMTFTLLEGGAGPGPGPQPGEDCIPDACDFAIAGFTDEFNAQAKGVDFDGDGEIDYYVWNSLPKDICIQIANKGEIAIGELKLLADLYEKVCGPTIIIFDDPKYNLQDFPCCGDLYPFYFPENGDWYIEDDCDGDSWVLQGGADNRWLTNNQAWRNTKGEDRTYGADDDVYLGKSDECPANAYDNLTTPAFDIAGVACATFKFSHWCEGEYTIDEDGNVNPVDYGRLAYSLDNGTTWTLISLLDFLAYDTDGEWQEVTLRFMNSALDDDDLPYMHPYNMICDDCEPDEDDIVIDADLSNALLRVKFIWDKDPCLQFEGWYIDGVQVTVTLDYELELVCQTHEVIELPGCDPETGVVWTDYCFPLPCDVEDDTWYELHIYGQVFDPMGCEADIENNEFKYQFKIVDIHDVACIEILPDEQQFVQPGDNVPFNVTVQNIGTYGEDNVPVDINIAPVVTVPMLEDHFETDTTGDYLVYYFTVNGVPSLTPLEHTQGWDAIDNIYDSSPATARSMLPGSESIIFAENLGGYPTLPEDVAELFVYDGYIDLDQNDNGVQDCADAIGARMTFSAKWSMDVNALGEVGSGVWLTTLPTEGSLSNYFIRHSLYSTSQDSDGYENDWQPYDIDLYELIYDTYMVWAPSIGYPYDFMPEIQIGFFIYSQGPNNAVDFGVSGINMDPNGGCSNYNNPVPWTGYMLDNWKIIEEDYDSANMETFTTLYTGELQPGETETLYGSWPAELCTHAILADVNLPGDVDTTNDGCCAVIVTGADIENCFDYAVEDLTGEGDCLWQVCCNRGTADDCFAWAGVETAHSAQYIDDMDDYLVSPTLDLRGYEAEGVAVNFTTWYKFYDSNDFGEVQVKRTYDHDSDPATANITTWWRIWKNPKLSTGGAFEHETAFIPEEICMSNNITQVRFRMFSDSSGVDEGWYIDDVQLVDVTDDGVAAPGAAWDIQLAVDLVAESGAAGNAGAEFDGDYLYSTRWASNLIHQYDLSGSLVQQFSISGVSGLRDLAFDGTHMFGGAAGTTIYEMDFQAQTLITTHSVPGAGVRAIAYNPDDNVFYCSNWGDPVQVIDATTFNEIDTFNLGVATSTYGMAYDNDGGSKSLYVYDQTGGYGTGRIYQWDLDAGSMIGIVHDTASDFPDGNALAGGLWIDPGFVPGTVSIGALQQGTPDMLIVYELRTGGGGGGGDLTFGDPICGMWQGPDTCVEDFEDQDISPWTCESGRGGQHWYKTSDPTTIPNEADPLPEDVCDECTEGWYAINSVNLVPWGYNQYQTINNAIAFKLDLTDPMLNPNFIVFGCMMNYNLNKERIYIEISSDWDGTSPMESATWTPYWVHSPGDEYGDDTGGWISLEDLTGLYDPYAGERWNLDEFYGDIIWIRFRLEADGNGAGIGEGWAIDQLSLEFKLTGTAFEDNQAPTTSLYYDDSTGTVTLVAVDLPLNKGVGVDATYYKIDGGAQQTYGGPFKITEGSHTVEYWSVDNNGNTESHKTATLSFDTTPPVVTIIKPEAGKLYLFGSPIMNRILSTTTLCIGKVPVEATATDTSGILNVLFKYDGETHWDDSSPYTDTYREMHFGPMTISVSAIDNNGLESAPVTMDIIVYNLGLF